MYETIINRFAKNKSELYSEYIIITMLVISFINVFYKVIANLIGTEVKKQAPAYNTYVYKKRTMFVLFYFIILST